MNKEIFLLSLEKKLKRLKKADRERFLEYYREMIEDLMEDGCSETEAVSRIGDADTVAKEILAEAGTPQTPGSKALIAVLLILGSPLWASILLAVLALGLAAAVTIAALVLSGALLILSAYLLIWCAPLITGSVALASLILSVISLLGAFPVGTSLAALGLVQFGTGIVMAGTFLFFTALTCLFSKSLAGITLRFSRWLSRLFHKIFSGKRGVTT